MQPGIRSAPTSQIRIHLQLFLLACAYILLTCGTQAQPGDLDTSFGVGGKVITSVGSNSRARALLLQADGRIVAVGQAWTFATGRNDFALVRYNVDGGLDSSFGVEGMVTTDFGEIADDYAECAVLQGDGRIVVAGSARQQGRDVVALARYLTDGTLDTAFGNGGKVITAIGDNGDFAYGVALQPDGKIVVTGVTANKLLLMRYNSDGTLDSSFGDDGKVITDLLGRTEGRGVVVRRDGRIVVGGVHKRFGDPSVAALFRYEPDGGGPLPVLTEIYDAEVRCVTLEANQSILLAGYRSSAQAFVARYNETLHLDRDFNSFGVAYSGAYSEMTYGQSVAVQENGKILMAGWSFESGLLLERRLANGSLDLGFGVDGQVRCAGVYANAVAAQSDGKVVVAGSPTYANDQFVIARFLGGDRSFATMLFPYAGGISKGPIGVDYYLSDSAQPGSVSLRFDDGNAVRELIASASQESAGTHRFLFDPNEPVNSSQGALASGEALPDGTYNVTLSYIDMTGANAIPATNEAFTIDTIPPTIMAPVEGFSPIVLESTNQDSVSLPDYRSQAITGEGATTNVTQLPAPGSLQKAGKITVTLGVNDFVGNLANVSFVVEVIDRTPPVILPPLDGFVPLELYALNTEPVSLPDYRGQALVNDATANRLQEPAPGTALEAGTYLIKLTAIDPSENAASLTFHVTVRGSEILALKGTAIPAAGVDQRIPEGSVWGSFGLPSITKAGENAGWLARVRTSSGGSFEGIFLGPLREPTLRLKTGDIAADSGENALSMITFVTFREPVFSGDNFAVAATVAGASVTTSNDTGVWYGSGGVLYEVAKEGAIAPDSKSRFRRFTSLAMPSPGTLYFTAKLSAPSTRDAGLWIWTKSQGTRLVLRTGDLFSIFGQARTIRSIVALTPLKGSPGHGRYNAVDGTLDLQLIFTDGASAALSIAANGDLRLDALSGERFSEDSTLLRIGFPSSTQNGEAVALATSAPSGGDGKTVRNSKGIFDCLRKEFIVKKGDVAPGAVSTLGTFASLSNPIAGRIGAAGEALRLFAATLSGVPADRNSGLWQHTQSGGLRLVAAEGDEAIGAPGTRWAEFTAAAVIDGRGPVFTARLTSGSIAVTSAEDMGLWATDSSGALRLVLREGSEPLPGRTLKSFSVLSAIAGSPGQRRFSTPGDPAVHIIYRGDFTDGSIGVLCSPIP